METEYPTPGIPGTPLPLASPRWKSLKAHFDNAGVDGQLPAVPVLLERWHEAVGTYAEELEYVDLCESYLHQGTILDVAYAVVPHLVSRLDELDPDRRCRLLDDVESVEDTRQVSREEVAARVEKLNRTVAVGLRDLFVQSVLDRHPLLPGDLAAAYFDAIDRAKRVAGAAWGKATSEEPGPQHFRRHIRFLRQAGCSDDDIVFGVTTLNGNQREGALVFEDPSVALQGLRDSVDMPPGWLERTALSSGTEQERLVFHALHDLAWHTDVRETLRAHISSADTAG